LDRGHDLAGPGDECRVGRVAQRGEVVADLVGCGEPHQDRRVLGAGEAGPQREAHQLAGAGADEVAQLVQAGVDDRDARGGEPAFPQPVVARPEHAGSLGVVGAGEQSLGERLVDQHPHVVLIREGEDPLRAVGGGQEVVADGQDVGADGVEQRPEPGHLVAAGVRPGGQPIGGEPVGAAHPDRADQPAGLEVAHGVDGGGQPAVAGAEVAVVQEVDVQVAGAEVLQGLVQLAADVAGRVAVRGGPGEVADLGDQHEVLAGYLGDELAQEPLGVAVPVDVGGVEQASAQLVGDLQPAPAGPVVGAGPAHRQAQVVIRPADRPAADADRWHGDPGGPQRPGRDGHEALRSLAAGAGRRWGAV